MAAAAQFDPDGFDAAFDAAVANCRELTPDQARHFVEHGHVVVKGAFPRGLADLVCECAWDELKAKYGAERGEPDSWRRVGHGGRSGYVRTQGTGRRFTLKTRAPRALTLQADVVGGPQRLTGNGESLAWGDAAIGNLHVASAPAWRPPGPRQPGWHKDGWHFRHFLNSPEQGLLTVPIYTDILPRSGGTFIARDSVGPVARLLASRPAGFHPDGFQAGYLIPGLIEQCSDFVELTGEAGDLVLVHPYVLHRVSVNPSPRPRFIANMALVLAEPMCFSRPPGEGYSLVELAILRALKVPSFDFEQTRTALAVKPFPFRDEEEAEAQGRLVTEEIAEMEDCGIVAPGWAGDLGYA
ncbi:MAG: hypothetical protein OXK76_04170 [Gammaproteobacteria bacterium]|nr:hypothetical protein [Gammaproteobacteria bacterium]